MQRYDFVLSGAYKKWNLRYMFALRKVFALVFSELLAHIWYLHLNIICELHFWHTKSLYRSRTDRCLYTILALKKIKKIKKNQFFFYKRHFTRVCYWWSWITKGCIAWLCRGFDFYEVKKKKLKVSFFKKKIEILLHF